MAWPASSATRVSASDRPDGPSATGHVMSMTWWGRGGIAVGGCAWQGRGLPQATQKALLPRNKNADKRHCTVIPPAHHRAPTLT